MEIVLHFYLEEEVTPRIFAQKVADGLARSGTLREGERVSSGDYIFEYAGDVMIDVFGDKRPVKVPRVEQVHP